MGWSGGGTTLEALCVMEPSFVQKAGPNTIQMTNGGLLFVGVPGAQSDDERANSKVRITHMEREKAGVFAVNRMFKKVNMAQKEIMIKKTTWEVENGPMRAPNHSVVPRISVARVEC